MKLSEKGQSISQFETVVQSQSFTMAQTALTAEGWQFADATVLNLLEKLRKAGTPLGEYINNRFYYGIKTGLNEAFVVDRATRDKLIAEHPSSAEVLKPFLRGRDVKRWTVDYADLYLIKIESSENKQHPWTGLPEPKAEQIFSQTYPAIHKHFSQFRAALVKRCDQGKFFWELRSCIYWQEFERSKIFYQEIATYQAFAWDDAGCYSNNKTFLIPDASLYLLALLNSKIVWFFLNHTVQKMAGGTFALQTIYIENIPIPPASAQDKATIETLVTYILFLAEQLKDIPSHGAALAASADDKLMLSYFEQLVDAIVLELYLPEELHASNKYFLRHLRTEKLLKLDQILGDKLDSLHIIFRRLFKKDHPIRENIFFLNSVPVVRTIRGLK